MRTLKEIKWHPLLLWPVFAVLMTLNACAPAINDAIKEEHIKLAMTLEQTGDTASAVEELKIALTIDPNSTDAKARLQKLIETRDREARMHYEKGLSLKESNPREAAKEFLAALHKKPDYHSAVDELKKQHLESALSKSEIRTMASRGNGEEEKEIRDDDYGYLGIAVSFYEHGNYQAAINELLKARSRYPRSPEVIKYLDLSYYNMGKIYYDKKDYMNAMQMLIKVNRGPKHTEPHASKTRTLLKNMADIFYREGLQYYRRQNLQEAIARWNTVLEIEPHHRKAQEYIQKSRKLLEALKK